ncbi:MAG: fibronectin type III domain-containing protein [Cyclobacteriaceae bacterium]|nr:fibronectin type III domain-containing protein [Cyclobacteriaceae bacterium]
MVYRSFLIGFLSCLPFISVLGQTGEFVVEDISHREVVAGTGGCATPPLCDYNKMVSWDDTQIRQNALRIMQNGNVLEFINWRMALPLNYNPDREEPYPMIVMLHGAGESGRIWTGQYNYANTDVRFDNNGHNLLHGGQQHWNAVNRNPNLSNSFPGIVIWPQASYNGAWENGWNGGNLNPTGLLVTKVIEWMVLQKNVDPDRIYMHGLSNGGKGTWDLAAKRPDLFAAILPMAGVGSDNNQMAPILNTMPLWLFQGGTDTNPRPQAAADAIAALQAQGGDPRYTLYPTLGHGVWNTAYAEADFFPWMKSQSKKNIYVFGGEAAICPGGTLKLGFSANMLQYQWMRNDEDIPGATGRYYDATLTGTYVVKYKRRFGPDVWVHSNPTVVGTKSSSTFVPELTNTGSTILTVDLAGVDNRINFTATPGYSTYYWFRNGIQVASGSSNTRQISAGTGAVGDAGLYTVRVLEGTGCTSAPSNTIQVYWNASQPTSPRPTSPTMTGISATQINVSWPDYSGEVGYELWRIRFGLAGYSFQPWTLVTVLPANTTSYVDGGLRPEGIYRYVIRAILPSGQGIFSLEPNVNGVPLPDLIPPTAPTNLVATNVTDTQVTLTWDPSIDNDRIYRYEIYNGSTLVHTLQGTSEAVTPPPTTYTVTGLASGMTYLFSVRAIDWKLNYSPFAEAVQVSTLGSQNGLVFKYYSTAPNGLAGTGTTQLAEPGGFNFSQTPTQTGVISNFSIAGANVFQGTTDPNNFVYAFDGFFQAPFTGNYRFFTRSDDGSRMYLNGNLIVNNDGAHGPVTVVSNSINLTAGVKYPIRVTFFENGGGQELGVRHTFAAGTNNNTTYPGSPTIQDAWLFQTGTAIVNYYSKNSGDLNVLSTWGTNTDGTGTAPPNFTTDYRYFHIRNRATFNLNSDWTVSGLGSKVIVGNGTNAITLNVNEALNAIVETNNNATINLNHSTIPQFGLMHTNSTVNFNVASVTVPNASYGNVSLAATGLYNLPMNTTTIKGNLTLETGATTAGIANNLSTLRVGGNLFINNSGNPFPGNGGQQYTLVFTGGINHLVSFANPVDINLFSIQIDGGDNVTFNNLNGQTITLGSNQGGGLVIKSGSSLNLGNNNLVLNGRSTINSNNETGSLIMEGGSFTFNSSATQNSNVYFNDSWINNLTSSTPTNFRMNILSNVNVNNLVTVSGELNTTEGNVTLISTSDAANGTARIGPLLNGASVTGKIKVQRYMSGEGRIYRYISSPVAGVSAADLQVFFPITGNFTGASSGTGIISGNASMFHYVEPGYVQFPSVGGTNLETLQRGKGYVPYIREGLEETVWEIMGEPHQGSIPFSLTGGTGSENDGWNLLGNPYPAPIQWGGAGWTGSGVNTVAYVRENSGNTTTVRTSGVNWDGVIAPGQAFWVRTTAGSPALTLNENAKTTIDGAFYREGAPNNQVKITMLNATYEDAAVIHFADGATTAFDTELDGVKQDNTFFNLSSLTTDNKPMALNRTTPDYCTQEVRLRTTNVANGAYTLLIEGVENIISGDKVTFIDHFTSTEKTITGDEQYPFSITSDPASKADGRFVLRFEKPAVRLDMALESFAACEQDNPIIRITNAQPGVEYTAFHNGLAISEGIVATGNVLDLPVNPELVSYGNTQASLKAGFRSCNSFDMPQTIMVHRDTLTLPEVSSYNNQVMASTENAQYKWYFEGEELLDETRRIIEYPLNGEYQVEVTLGTCTKLSDPFIFVITSLENNVTQSQPHPNPTKDKVVVTLEQPIALHTVRTATVLGQLVPAPATPLTERSVEINLSELPAGLYFLYVNERRYRIIKE